MTKREKRLQDLRRKISRMERDRELGIKLLVKAVTALPALRKQEARLSAGWHPKDDPKPTDKPADPLAAWPVPPPADYRPDDDIPTFLDRTNSNKDAQARAEIEAEQAAGKKRKAERRIAKLKISQEVKHAELTGQRRKMPLTGRAALDALK